MKAAPHHNHHQFWTGCRKIVAVGRNYAAHAKELGNAVPTSPVLFLKPVSSFVRMPEPVLCPPKVTSLHHEVELGVVIGKGGRDILPENALSHVAGYTLALDMTARNLQDEAKSKGLPWSVAKGYDTFCPIGDFVSAESIADPSDVELWFKIDGELKQKGNTSLMLFPVTNLISYISTVMTLEQGDVILTGTPEGVGPVKVGQKMTAGMLYKGKELAAIEFSVAARQYAQELSGKL